MTFTSSRSQQRFHSDICRIGYRRAQLKAAHDAEAAGRVCRHCGAPMPVAKRLNARYCSRFCKVQAQRARVRGSGRHQRKPGEYEALLDAQQGRCAICGTDTPGAMQRLFAIDHDHVTGKVRGLLCYSWNVSLGHFQDDPERLEQAAAYLRDPPVNRS